jgi:Spy/CpxP family protein refolding chaperone
VIKTRVVLLLCFLAAFGAGTCVGLVWRQQAAKPAHEGWLSELDLTPEQQEKIRAIWTETMRNSDWQGQREKRSAAQKERDEAVKALLSAEQQPRYDEILAAYQKKADEISLAGRKARDEATEKTKALLSESQRVTYEELLKKRAESRGRGRTDAAKKPTEGSVPETVGPAAEGKGPDGTPPGK